MSNSRALKLPGILHYVKNCLSSDVIKFKAYLPAIGNISGFVTEGINGKEALDLVAMQNDLSLVWQYHQELGKYQLVAIADDSGQIIAEKDQISGFHFFCR